MAISAVNLFCLSDPHDLHDMAVHPRARLQDAKEYPQSKLQTQKTPKAENLLPALVHPVPQGGRATHTVWNRPGGPRDQVSVNLSYLERSLAVTVSTLYAFD